VLHSTDYLIFVCAGLGVAVLCLWFYQSRMRRRTDLLERLLDGTDALEAALQATRKRMNAMKSVVERVPADIAAVAQASLDADTPVQQGLRNVLEHRLWIARSAQTATIAELQTAVNAVERSRKQIETRLGQLEHAGAELAEITRSAAEQEAREPAALRRGAAGHHPD
jgi:biopolymer transport protein ExbB/TolQ